jgi:MFS transporter, ACDE family, multidrug resistance protein
MSRRPPLVFIFAVTLTGILSNTLITPAIPDILDEFGVPASRAGILVAAGSVAGIVIAPVVGVLADRYGRRIVLTACLAVFGLFGGVAALSPSFDTLLLARFLQGVGSAGLVNLAVVLIGDHWTGLDRTRLIGRNSAILTVGLASLPLISGATTEAFGWRWTFVIYTVALITAAVSWMVLDARRPEEPPVFRDQIREAGAVVRQPAVMVILAVGFLVFVVIFGLFLTVFPVHLAEKFGLEAGARGVLIALPALTSSLMAFNLGRVRRVLTPRMAVIFSAIGFCMAYFILGIAGAILVVAPAVLVYGACEGLMVPILQDLAMEASPDAHRGAVIAVWVSAARLGQTVGPLLAGVSLALWGTSVTLVAGSAVALLILVLGIFGPLSRTTHDAPETTRLA